MSAETEASIPAPAGIQVPPPQVMPDGSIRGYYVEEYVIPREALPNLDTLVIEDDTPLDNIFAEKQQRLLTEPLYSTWPGPGNGRPFQVFANVGLFYKNNTPGLAPDVMLSLDVKPGDDLSKRENRSYFIWEMGKTPDVAIEFVSDRRGRERTGKLEQYAQIGVPYYVVFDPENRLGQGPLQAFVLVGRTYEPKTDTWFPAVALGLKLWQGVFEGRLWTWLRWCDQNGEVILTGSELAEQEGRHAEQEGRHAEQERQRAEQERQRAEQERQRAEQEHQQLEAERQQRERLEAKLRALGVDPSA